MGRELTIIPHSSVVTVNHARLADGLSAFTCPCTYPVTDPLQPTVKEESSVHVKSKMTPAYPEGFSCPILNFIMIVPRSEHSRADLDERRR